MDTLLSPGFVFLISLILFFSPCNANQTTNKCSSATYQPFIQCILANSIPHNLLYIQGTTSYSTLLEYSIRNQRFNTTSTPKPLAIITPTIESHVSTIVGCCRTNNLEARVLSGGHDYEGLSYVAFSTPFVIINMQNISSIDVNTTDNTAWVQAGATVGELYYHMAEKSKTLGFPAGLCPTVGIGGHLSGGGIGTMMRKYGLASDNIIDVRLVNVEGKILDRESMGEDLFWAIRGGGGASFGIILAYKIKLVHVPQKLTIFAKSYNLSQNGSLVKIVSQWQDVAYRLDVRLFIRQFIQVSSDNKGNRILQIKFESLFLGEKEELLSIIQEKFPLLDLQVQECQEMSWIETIQYFAGYTNGEPLSALLERKSQFGYSFKAKSDFLTSQIPEFGWKRIWYKLLRSNATVYMIIDPLGGKMDEISESETPFPYRNGSLYNIQHLVAWVDGDQSLVNTYLDWIRGFYEFMTPYVSKNPRAAYLNYRDLDLGTSLNGDLSYFERTRWGKRYFKDNFRKLALVKLEVDPKNFFRSEQSVPPLNLY
ncbi:FAD-binding Berberine family protein [Rhynchospora pubera]|uniref:FAD-binding Berberine family protein n=1 Tax=Rhynchospora pubera TaxID=906938 RepID=A0AAV8G606_9POAL|nr:FAD-binding Berberine family protein [Rhynchospora pubera]